MREKVCGIYCIKNLIDGKKYIGYSSDIKTRWRKHVSSLNLGTHVNNYLQNSWNLYGKNNFSFFILEECNKDILSEREIYYINELNTFLPNGYNLTLGGEGGIHCEETKIKISKANKGKVVSKETRKKLAEIQTGKTYGDDTKAKLSKINSGEGNGFYGKTHSKESRDKISKAHKGKTISKEHRDKISKAQKGKTVSEETRHKLSESLKKWHANKKKKSDEDNQIDS